MYKMTYFVYWCVYCEIGFQQECQVAEALRCPRCDRLMRSERQEREITVGGKGRKDLFGGVKDE